MTYKIYKFRWDGLHRISSRVADNKIETLELARERALAYKEKFYRCFDQLVIVESERAHQAKIIEIL